MSVPFSNTNLRIPRGFGNLLECLAKEVLRDQPEDIPTFAAHYFTKLLKAREESGLDPAEWGAKLEDRFYNNHSFKDGEVAKEDVDIDICRSELEPTPLPSFGGLANVDVCAEEINHLSELTEYNRDMESPKLKEGEFETHNESFVETPSHIEEDVDKQANE
uniref:RIIa domain-containing protein n=1 Tax=Cyprinus carpio TaxID=7962 RepID=A0A8C2B069_CYPCA